VILVDSSVWIDYFNGLPTPQTDALDAALEREEILVGDLILCEVLQGFVYDKDFTSARDALMRFNHASLLNPALAVRCAEYYRRLRKMGITVRKTIDCIIATYCIDNQIPLLHNDHDFDPFEQHLGLAVVHP
jgi:predicted nucleic acid-binding protein